MEAYAKLNKLSTSARKARLVIQPIRGKGVEDALAQLSLQTKRASEPIRKLLLSAVANLQQKYKEENFKKSDLYISSVFANVGTMSKRIKPAAQGRAHRIRKRTCHVTIIVKPKPVDKTETPQS